MKSKTFIILLVVCAVLGGVAYWQLNKGGSGKAVGVKMGDVLFNDLSVNDIAAISISGPENSVALEKTTVWEVENRFGYPADFAKITELVKKLRSVTVGRSFTGDEETRTRLSLLLPDKEGVEEDAKGTRIVLSNADGKALVDVLVGDPRDSGGHYLMPLTGDTVYLVDKNFRNMQTNPKDWLVKDLLKADSADIQEVVCKKADADETVYVLARPEKGKDPEFSTRPQGYENQEAKTNELNTIFGALSSFQIEDVADPANKPAEDSFKHVFEYRLFDGRWYKVSLGEAVSGNDDNYYVKVRAGFTAPPVEDADSEGNEPAAEVPEDDPEAQKKAEEKKKAKEERRQKQAELKEKALELDEKLQSWTYIIQEWRYNKFKTDLAALFEEPPAEEESKEGALED